MIRSIHIKNAHAHRDTKVQFGTGMISISGPNETGKTQFYELGLRFALFGSAALRGGVDDYKGVSVETCFDVKGTSWRIERTTTSAKLFRDGETKAIVTGTTPVNKHIMDLFGYGIEVFDVAHACCQGEIEALGKMRPTERKRLVDRVVGAQVLEELADWAGKQGTSLKRDVAAMRSVIIAPEKPHPPMDYENSSKLEPLARKLRQDATRQAELIALTRQTMAEPQEPVAPCAETASQLEPIVRQRETWTKRLSVVEAKLAHPPSEPVQPFSPCDDTAAELQTHEDKRRQLAGQAAELDSLPVPSMDLEAIQAAETAWARRRAYLDAQQKLARERKPTTSREKAEQLAKQWADRQHWLEHQKLLQAGHHKCPSCGFTWPVERERIESLGSAVETPEPAVKQTQVREILQAWERWDANEPERQKLLGVPEEAEPLVTENEIAAAKHALALKPRRAAAEKAASQLVGMADRSTDLRARMAYEADYAAYQKELANWNAWLQASQTLQTEAKSLKDQIAQTPDRSEDLQARRSFEAAHATWADAHKAWQRFESARQSAVKELAAMPAGLAEAAEYCEAALAASRAYESALADWEKRQAEHERVLKDVQAKEALSTDWDRGKTALLDVSSKLKTYLAPAINSVASRLLSQMTGGQRTTIEVDKDFDILVDGQRMRTLSGSASAVANLALRIALGKVLTSGVFPVLILDEIDAAMDQARAEYTMECVSRLKQTFTQVIVISHKTVESDHEIRLGA